MTRWLLVLIGFSLTRCLSPSTPLAAVIEVRSAQTGLPITGAIVQTRSGNLFIPPRDIVAPPTSPWATPSGDRRTTDEKGIVHVHLASNRPTELEVSAAGYAPLHLTLEAAASDIRGARDWTEGRLQPARADMPSVPLLEVRVHASD